jgi:hypothetical protein
MKVPTFLVNLDYQVISFLDHINHVLSTLEVLRDGETEFKVHSYLRTLLCALGRYHDAKKKHFGRRVIQYLRSFLTYARSFALKMLLPLIITKYFVYWYMSGHKEYI